ncbi:MAG: hypothetical protein NTY41_17600 [Proteobacteria bacterium]|nr:hypothetical protein [Pseudomonadota bacterium]
MDYAQSRLQARFGERPDELLWQKLEAVPEPAAALEIARTSGLKRWVAGIAPHADSHAMEIALRARWRECVTEIGSWMPDSWQPALLWTRGLVDLPALCHLARGGTPLPWMFGDAVLQTYARADATTRETLLREDCRIFMGSSFEAQGRAGLPRGPWSSQICQVWLDEWRRRWPRWSDTAALEHLARLLDAAIKQPAVIGRPELLRKLRSLFRRSVLRPVAAFIYIAFAALDLERLRAGLLKHALAREGIIPS